MGAMEERKQFVINKLLEIIKGIESDKIVVFSGRVESRLEDCAIHGIIERHETGYRILTIEYQEING